MKIIKIELNDRIEWRDKNNHLHRIDGPAIEWFNGKKEWYQHGRRHRVDGPAFDDITIYKAWWINGRRHRDDGPAIEYPTGNKEWWRNGEFIKNCYPKIVSYIKNKNTENEEEMELELCCKECAKLYYNLSEKEFERIKNGDTNNVNS